MIQKGTYIMSSQDEYKQAQEYAYYVEDQSFHQRVMLIPFIISAVIVLLTSYGMKVSNSQLNYSDIIDSGETVTAEVEELGVEGGKITKLLARCNLSLIRFGAPYKFRVFYKYGEGEYSETRYITHQVYTILSEYVDDSENIELLIDPDSPNRFTTKAIIEHYQSHRVLKKVVNIIMLIIFGYMVIDCLFIFLWRGHMKII